MNALIEESRSAMRARQRSVTTSDVSVRACSDRASSATVRGDSADMLDGLLGGFARQVQIPIRRAERRRGLREPFEEWTELRQPSPVGVTQRLRQPLLDCHWSY